MPIVSHTLISRLAFLFCLSVSILGSVGWGLPLSANENVAAVWNFEGADPLGEWKGKGFRVAEGPRAPIYTGFESKNQAMELMGKDAALLVPDAPNLRFKKGDAITLEMWVKVRQLRDGQIVHLINKGRNKTKEFGEMNQNYGLRIRGVNGGAVLGFIFTSEADAGQKPKWHLWWSAETFQLDTGWHHLAITYTFGKKDSLRGYVDGQAMKGSWAVDGATDRAPVTDGDFLVIGTGYSRGTSETLEGWMDQVAIHRTALPDAVLKSRYAVGQAKPLVDVDKLPEGKVLVELCEKGIPEQNRWPVESPVATESYVEEAFGFAEFPQHYISTGVRGDRARTFVFRASAKVTMPKGKNRLLLRGRGASRLFVDGQLIAETAFPPRAYAGFALLTAQENYLNLGPDFRFAPPGNQEKVVDFVSEGKEHVVILETILGGARGRTFYRPELGETVVAMAAEGSHAWHLLSPSAKRFPYTDKSWNHYQSERQARFAKMNAEARAKRRREHQPYWAGRRAAAEKWLKSTPEVTVPPLPKGFPAHNAIDHFLAARIVEIRPDVSEGAKTGIDFHRDIHPILEAKCFSCHQGGETKGGLVLDSRDAAMKGGKSDGPAIVPGKPKESALLMRATADPDEIMPPKGDPLNQEELALLEAWIAEGATWPELQVSTLKMTSLTDDLTFLRRLNLDTVGVPPTEEEIATFLADKSPEKRSKVIDQRLADPRWADRWMGYWQDILGENPNILNPTLNNTGPFRWWIYESLQDDKALDLMVTELIRMEGSTHFGGPAGFAMAAQNDVPMAQKALVLSSAFLGVEMKCARCHDSPANTTKQQDLFEMAAMLQKKPIKLPATSSVPLDRLQHGGREPLIKITLKPDSVVEATWPFAHISSADASALAEHPEDSRDRLAALLTAPQNTRFAQVIVNRFWQQLMGRGIVEPVEDWEKGRPSHPELLEWLGREFVRSGYRVKSLQRLIFNSHAYQRQVDPSLSKQEPLFVSPAPRRLAAEQIVDSLFAVTGKPFRTEEMSLDIDGDRTVSESITLGQPSRSWMLASTSNERDRPSLMLPRIQAVADVLEIFGWRGTRVDPISYRENSANVLQPAILSNGTVSGWLTRLSEDHGLTQLALESQPVEALVNRLFLRILTREPNPRELQLYVSLLSPGFNERVIPRDQLPTLPSKPRTREKYISWSNHVDGEANALREKHAQQARQGDPPTARLNADWRNRMEDVVWALLNAPSSVTLP